MQKGTIKDDGPFIVTMPVKEIMVYLFTSKKVDDFLAEREKNLTKSIDNFLDSQIHKEDLESIVDRFYKKGMVTINKLEKEKYEKKFTTVEHSGIRGKYIVEAVEYRIPYTGSQDYFELSPKIWSHNSPVVDEINNRELIFKLWNADGANITNNEDVQNSIKAGKDTIVNKIEEWMQKLDVELVEFNSTLQGKIRNYVINKMRGDDDRRNSLDNL